MPGTLPDPPEQADPALAPRHVLPLVVLAQLLGTSPWFAVNAVMGDLQAERGFAASDLGALTSAVQLGFIAGTLVFALLAVADRFSARRVFFGCALASAACTLLAAAGSSFAWLWGWRTASGFCLAGIYPVGMKIAALWFPRGLGGALGLLVGALVLGTASPHALRALGTAWPWQAVFGGVALASLLAGALVLALPEPPNAASGRGAGVHLRDLASLVTDRRVRASVFGYFGHMWELYAMLVLVPLILATRLQGTALSWAAFAVIGAGALGCAVGGWLAPRWGSARVAAWNLGASGLCGLVAPWLLSAGDAVFLIWLLVWGFTVAGDSPQFSALTATNAPHHSVGSVLTLTNCIGFSISIVTIQLFTAAVERAPLGEVLPWLAFGPALGLLALRPLLRRSAATRPQPSA